MFTNCILDTHIILNELSGLIHNDNFSQINLNLFCHCNLNGITAKYITFNGYLFYKDKIRILEKEMNLYCKRKSKFIKLYF